MALKTGDAAPSIALEDQNGEMRRLDDLEGRILVLFFYPKDDTPGCTAEACTFRDNYANLTALGAEVWGVSGDDVVSHRRFAERHQLQFPLLSDKTGSLRRAFGVPKTFGLLPARVTYVIDQKGVIQLVFNNLLDGPAHVKEAESIVRTLAAG
ncbi:MAG: peroxiredoxin [Synechococcus sp. BS307-5m-G39]|nr:peroxiredoxin [Synechococcus sp. BS307-5m-G39]